MTEAGSTPVVLTPERRETLFSLVAFSLAFDRQKRTPRPSLDVEAEPHYQEGLCPDKDFEYLPLPDGYIRLAIIHPGEGRLVCSLAMASLEALPHYEALSYVWGTSKEPQISSKQLGFLYSKRPWEIPERAWEMECRYIGQITRDFDPNEETGPSQTQLSGALLESGKVPITDNLGFSLEGLRHVSKFRVLWVDSLCINQKTLDERSQQIKLMYQIYKQAEQVVIWLGQSTESTSEAFQCIRDIYKLQIERQRRRRRRKRQGTPSSNFDVGFYFPVTQWWSLANLLESSWFRRVWVFQEQVASTKSIVQRGNYSIDWQVFSRACGMVQEFLAGNRIMLGGNGLCWIGSEVVDMPFIETGGQKVKNSEHSVAPSLQTLPEGKHWGDGLYISEMPKAVLDTIRSMDAMKRSLREVDEKSARDIGNHSSRNDLNRLGLIQLLPMLRPAGSTDPLDKVFALMNIADPESDNSSQAISIDYRILPRDLYISTMSYWLFSGQSPNLGFLSHVQPSHSSYGLPSFVPDWSIPLKSRPLSELGRGYKASGDSRCVANLQHETLKGSTSATLTVRGVRLLQLESWIDIMNLPNMPKALLRLLGPYGSRIHHEKHEENLPTQYKTFTTLLGHIFSMRFKNVYGTTPESFCLALESTLLLAAPETNPLRGDLIKFWESISVDTSPPEIDHRVTQLDFWEQCVGGVRLKEIQTACEVMAGTRHIFCTAEGYIGLGPPIYFESDCDICIIFGCPTPFIIRKEKNWYRLIGECYVAGLMAGEAMEGLDPEKIEDLKFR